MNPVPAKHPNTNANDNITESARFFNIPIFYLLNECYIMLLVTQFNNTPPPPSCPIYIIHIHRGFIEDSYDYMHRFPDTKKEAVMY